MHVAVPSSSTENRVKGDLVRSSGFHLDTSKPIGEQLVAECARLIVTGAWKPGEKVPSVRVLAVYFGVNPNTMQKALAALEERGLLESPSTAGRFVTANAQLIGQTLEYVAQKHVRDFVSSMHALGVSENTVLQLVQKSWSSEPSFS